MKPSAIAGYLNILELAILTGDLVPQWQWCSTTYTDTSPNSTFCIDFPFMSYNQNSV